MRAGIELAHEPNLRWPGLILRPGAASSTKRPQVAQGQGVPYAPPLPAGH
jgi:hypothetical protein